jgi:hypothetical protein
VAHAALYTSPNDCWRSATAGPGVTSRRPGRPIGRIKWAIPFSSPLATFAEFYS